MKPTFFCGIEATDVTDTTNPLVHVLLTVCYQVENPVDGVDIKDVAVFKLLLVEGQPSINLLTQV